MPSTEARYKTAADAYSSAQRGTNDKMVLAAKKKAMDDASAELAAERAKNQPKTSLIDLLNKGRKK